MTERIVSNPVADYIEASAERAELERRSREREGYERELNEGVRKYLIPAISESLEELTERAPAVKKAYFAVADTLRKFCQELEVRPFPTSPEIVYWLLFHESVDNKADIARLKTLLAGISHLHALKQAYDPTTHILVRATLLHLKKKAKAKSASEKKPAAAVQDTGSTNAQLEGAEIQN